MFFPCLTPLGFVSWRGVEICLRTFFLSSVHMTLWFLWLLFLFWLVLLYIAPFLFIFSRANSLFNWVYLFSFILYYATLGYFFSFSLCCLILLTFICNLSLFVLFCSCLLMHLKSALFNSASLSPEVISNLPCYCRLFKLKKAYLFIVLNVNLEFCYELKHLTK